MGQSRGSRSPIVSTSSAPSMAVLRPHAFRIGIPLSATEQCSRIPNLHLRTIPPKQERMLNRRRSCAPVRPRPFRSCPPIILENGGCARNQLIQRMLRFSSFFIPSQIKELCKYLFFLYFENKGVTAPRNGRSDGATPSLPPGRAPQVPRIWGPGRPQTSSDARSVCPTAGGAGGSILLETFSVWTL